MSTQWGKIIWEVCVTVLVIVLCVLCPALGSCQMGKRVGEDRTRKEAIEAGAAHWWIDAKTGEKEFVWDGKTKERKEKVNIEYCPDCEGHGMVEGIQPLSQMQWNGRHGCGENEGERNECKRLR